MMVPTIADIRRAAERIAGRAVATPLLAAPALDERVGGRVLLKCENLQRTGSFKFRGAYNALAAMSREAREGGVVAVSSGNHAQGVAEAARLFGVKATIVMPADAPAIKRERTERSGAQLVFYDRARDDRDQVAARIVAEKGGTLVHPYDDLEVIAGQGTVGLEIAAEAKAAGLAPDTVLVPCGGGGLSAGIGLAILDSFPAAEIGVVEPEDFDDYGRSLRAGHEVANPRTAGSVCDALLAPSPGAMGFLINRQNLAIGHVVSDAEALAAVAFAFRELKLVVEPGGAVGLAALIAGTIDVRGKIAVAVLSGGNVDPELFSRLVA
jgi:threonine dehydratase